MPRVTKPPAKAACLACRSSKTRCDGQYPCRSCYNKGRDCSFQPSRRGGARRGIRYAETLQRNDRSDNAPSETILQHRSSPRNATETLDPFLENTMGLLTPFVGIHNLDLSPDTLSDTGEALQLWGQLTPGDGSFASASIDDVDLPTIRAYQSEEEILNAYYIYMHPYFPLLPPCPHLQHEDRSTFVQSSKQFAEPKKTDLPYWPVSSLSLALSAILVLIPPISDSSPMTEAAVLLRRSYAQLYAQAALASVEREVDELSPASSINLIGASISQEQSQLHSQVPLPLDPILALLVLAMYEYCQRGNVSRMRARVNHAVTTAMDISLHDLGSATTEYSEAQRRAWWMIPPIIASDDPRITTPFPRFGVNPEPWGLTIRVQKLLYAAHSMVQRIESVADSPLISNLGDEIKKLDAQIVILMIEADQSLRETFDFDGECYVAENMWRISRIMINT
ncbi:hypothetical protein N7520_011264 [Penicillium odoratum]|uniref:uncharacterized protein n=1 Tax=Penicillium odoratum TaxID=1167516 RepID=UPI0025491060|nr:uncharacterized protein N7520_011264 [Penicillium odoratum]KAJ5746082.1 hypothetical protein N7520_011264 [Penicillium odoratum]